MKVSIDEELARALMRIASSDGAAGAVGLKTTVLSLVGRDERLPRSLLRCALTSAVWSRYSGPDDTAKNARRAEHDSRRGPAIEAELIWLRGGSVEPPWPNFPTPSTRVERHVRIPPGDPASSEDLQVAAHLDPYEVHAQVAAAWLSAMGAILDSRKRPWVLEFIRAYGAWTSRANGSDLGQGLEVIDVPRDWNIAFFEVIARCLPGMTADEIDEHAIATLVTLPDDAFFDAIAIFVPGVDASYFVDAGLADEHAVRIRLHLARRTMNSRGWRRLIGDAADSIERYLGAGLATLFFNRHGFTSGPNCYLLPAGIPRAKPFLPILSELVVAGPSLFVAFLILNLFEVKWMPDHLPLLLEAVGNWLQKFPENRNFWLDHEIGRRVCRGISAVRDQVPVHNISSLDASGGIQRTIGGLIRAGVPEAALLEAELTRHS